MGGFMMSLSTTILAQPLLAQVEQAPAGLTTAGIVMMTLSIALVVGLSIFCLVRILRGNPSKSS